MARFVFSDNETVTIENSVESKQFYYFTVEDKEPDDGIATILVTLAQLETLAKGILAYVAKERS